MKSMHRLPVRLPHAILAAGCALCGPIASAGEGPDVGLLNSRSLVTMGDSARLQHVLAKARRGETVGVAVIGGSITGGARASRAELNYGNLIVRWWREHFPHTRILPVNAGIGATGSNYGALRAGRDLLSKRPDVVVVEFGVNDGNTQEAAESLEGLVRQILKQPQQPAVILLFMMHRNGANAQEWHGKVGRHYGLPMVSFRDALWPEIEGGRLAWADVEADIVHPNDRGHAYAAGFVTHAIGGLLAELPADALLPPVAPLPPPLISDLYEHVTLYEAAGLRPVTRDGWALSTGGGPRGWLSTVPGSTAVFELQGQGLCLMEWRLRGPLGKASIRVDTGAPLIRDAWFDQTWGGYRATLDLGRNLPRTTHRVTVTILDEKHPESNGHEYRILGLAALGAPPAAPAVLTHAYDFDDGGARDTAVGAALHGTLLGKPKVVAGVRGAGHALHLDGVTQSVRFAALDLGDEFAIGAWIKLDDNPVTEPENPHAGRQKIAMLFGSSPMGDRDGLLLFVNNQWAPSLDGILHLEVWHGKSVSVIRSVHRIPSGEWHHVAVAGDSRSGEVRVFIDGRPEPITVQGIPELGLASTARPWCLGASADGANGCRGAIDTVRIYRGRLTDKQALAMAR